MRFTVLGSGSKGNCTLVEAGTTRVLIDNGFSGKELLTRLRSLDIVPESLTALILTHEHDDHVKGAGVLARRFNLPVYGNEATLRAAEARMGKLPIYEEFGVGEDFTIEALRIHPFAVSHDAADPVGFVLSNGRGNLGYCTDTGTVTRLIRHRLRACQAVILEANHDVRMVKEGPYPLPLRQRVLSNRGHLANPDSLDLAAELAGERLRLLVLAHLSEINNRPELVLTEARQRLPAENRVRLLLASQGRACPLLEVGP